MSHLLPKLAILLLVMAGTSGMAQTQATNEPMFQGRALSSWMQSIQNRDEDMGQAFEAIREIGPDAAAAVPELTEILKEPFAGVRIGVDDEETIDQKLYDIQLRSDAVDSLGGIGKAAAPAADALIKWALTSRVTIEDMETQQDYEVFVNLVAADALERIRVANVISGFSLDVAPAILDLINSNDREEQKLAVSILRGHVLPIAAQLLNSDKCEDRQRGVALLMDLWSTVPTEYLNELRLSAACPLPTP